MQGVDGSLQTILKIMDTWELELEDPGSLACKTYGTVTIPNGRPIRK